MSFDLVLPIISEQEALSYLISYIRKINKPYHVLKITEVVSAYLDKERLKIKGQHPTGMTSYRSDLFKNSDPFYCAASNLCSRGILAPKPLSQQTQYSSYIEVGVCFYLTEYGYSWLTKTNEIHCLPTEYAKFSQLLVNHLNRYGRGYLSRSLEAVACYESHNYLACCAMCGAAAESILLALAIHKNGSQEKILRDYKSAGGRSKIERFLIGQRSDFIKQDFNTFISLLKYWRDESAHGSDSSIQEEEAFTSLLLLLRFAQFADSKWEELTS